MKAILLANRWDSSAAMIAAALRRRHPAEDVRVVTLDELIYAEQWAHRVGTGAPVSNVKLHDGFLIDSQSTDVVLNRLGPFDLPHFVGHDRAYAIAEMAALLTSWLESFPCPVINPVAPRTFCVTRSPLRTLALAAEARLPLPTVRMTSNVRRFAVDEQKLAKTPAIPLRTGLTTRQPATHVEPSGSERHTVLLAGDEICGELPAELIPACRAFARLAGTPVTTLSFTCDAEPNSPWRFASADPVPQLNEAHADVVARFLEAAATSERGSSTREIPVSANV